MIKSFHSLAFTQESKIFLYSKSIMVLSSIKVFLKTESSFCTMWEVGVWFNDFHMDIQFQPM